jgi:hypothetical protein
VAIFCTADSQASARICQQLQREVKQLQSTSGEGPSRSQLQRQFTRAEQKARRSGCLGRFLFFGPRPSKNCPSIMATLGDLKSQLKGGRRNMAGRSTERELKRIRTAMREHGCTAISQERAQAEQEQRTTIGGGGYRTLCVRTCDGYYFPISFSTTRKHFKKDEALCQSMYPQGVAALYVHRNPSEGSEHMVSLAGEAYAKQDFAFNYRKSYSAACYSLLRRPGAQPTNPSVASALPRSNAGAAVLLPVLRSGGVPESVANEVDEFTPAPVADLSSPPSGRGEQRPVRVVGSDYYYTLPNEYADDMASRLQSKPVLVLELGGAPERSSMLPILDVFGRK